MSENGYCPKLSKRLKTVKETVIPCGMCLDIGCDHGYVSIALARENIAGNVICLDINEGPLEAAEKNIRAAGVAKRVTTRLSDGFKEVSKDDKAEVTVIAGMGGRLTADILYAGEEIVKDLKQLVLEPQSELFLVREAVRRLGMHIERELFIKDRGKYYTVMDVRPGADNNEETENGLWDRFSKYLVMNKDALYREYLYKSVEKYEGYLSNLKDAGNSELTGKIGEINKVIALIDK